MLSHWSPSQCPRSPNNGGLKTSKYLNPIYNCFDTPNNKYHNLNIIFYLTKLLLKIKRDQNLSSNYLPVLLEVGTNQIILINKL